MLKFIGENGLTNKISLTLIGSSISTGAASFFGWIGAHASHLLTVATLILTIVMTFGHILEQFRKNRAEHMDNVKKELEIEKLRRDLKDKNN